MDSPTAEDWLERLVTPAKPNPEDPAPARFGHNIFVGCAQHAHNVDLLKELGVTAVLNLAPKACADNESRYEDQGISYCALDAEDAPGYSLFDLHLEPAAAFLEGVRTTDGLALVHCFAGVNRSAAIAIAFLMLSEKEQLEVIVKRCFAQRPWILTNASFRTQLCKLAGQHGLVPASQNGGAAVPNVNHRRSFYWYDPPTGAPSDEPAAATGAASSSDALSYSLEEPLQSGAFATVYRCTLRERSTIVAAKVVSRKAKYTWIGGKSVKSDRAYTSALNELAALRQVGPHPRVVGLEGWVEEAEQGLLFLELAPGGDLESLVATKPDGVGEAIAHGFASDLFAALAHCHGRGVTHRDVKLANLLLAADGTLRLADFGHAAVTEGWSGDEAHPRLTEKMGTKSYCAPEIIAVGDEGYVGPPTDLWSAGICWFTLLSGRLPFLMADDIADWRFAKVAAAQAAGGSSCTEILSWTQQVWPWGELALHQLDSLLSVEPDLRPTAAQAKRASNLTFHAVGRTRSFEPPPQVTASPVLLPTAARAASRTNLTRSREPSLTNLEPLPPPAQKILTRARSREASFDNSGEMKRTSSLKAVRGGRKRNSAEAQLDRSMMWRGMETQNRSEMQTSSDYPSSSVRYEVLQRQFDWLRDDRGCLPLVSADEPFKVAIANNNNYAWFTPPVVKDAPPNSAAEHPSRRSCPWAR